MIFYLGFFPFFKLLYGKGLKPEERKFNFGNGTILVFNSFMSKFKLPGKREPLKSLEVR